MADGDSQETSTAAVLEVEEPFNAGDNIDLDTDLDLENFGKKKKKKKKTGFNLEELEAALPVADESKEEESGTIPDDDSGAIDDNFDLDMKKKKKKKKEINELLKDNKENEELENGKRINLRITHQFAYNITLFY